MGSLDIRDIRKDSWLLNDRGNIFQSIGTKLDGKTEVVFGGDEVGNFQLSECSPIPLNKDILECAGLKFTGALWFTSDIDDFGKAAYEFAGNSVVVNLWRKDAGFCTALHELQNLHRSITKKDLPINPTALDAAVEKLKTESK